jgi:hypothetical protein
MSGFKRCNEKPQIKSDFETDTTTEINTKKLAEVGRAQTIIRTYLNANCTLDISKIAI